MDKEDDPKRPPNPTWQQAPSAVSETTARSSSITSANLSSPSLKISRSDLIEQAAKFLLDKDVRDKPLSDKIAFLKKKGLTQEEIEKLLDEAKDTKDGPETEKSSSDRDSKTSKTSTVKESSTLPHYTNTSTSGQPPIITYPEFLDRARRARAVKPPIISPGTIMSTLYATTIFSTTVWAAQKFLADPMLSSLTSARHDLAETTQSNLKTLITKLSNNVSEVPSSEMEKISGGERKKDEELESIDSDPTELFHRDIGVQTTSSLPLSRSSSIDLEESKTPPIEKHLSNINSLTDNIRTLLHQPPKGVSPQAALTDLRVYLNELAESGNIASRHPAWAMALNYKSVDDDGVEMMKREIRAVKGTLLAARNFPGSK